jgi:hypothetical protein
MRSAQLKSILWLLTGSALLVFLGWRWNIPAAAWPPFS